MTESHIEKREQGKMASCLAVYDDARANANAWRRLGASLPTAPSIVLSVTYAPTPIL